MKKYLMLFSLFFAYNAWAMEEAKQAYEELYREFPNGYEDKMAKHEYRKDNLQKLITIARKHVTDLDSRTQPKSFFSRMLGGGVLGGFAGYIGIQFWTKSGIEFFNKFLPVSLDSNQGSLIRNFITGTSAVLATVGGYYGLQGLYDWVYSESNCDSLKQHRRINRWLSPEDKEKETEDKRS